MLRFLFLFVTFFICSAASCQVSKDSCRVEGVFRGDIDFEAKSFYMAVRGAGCGDWRYSSRLDQQFTVTHSRDSFCVTLPANNATMGTLQTMYVWGRELWSKYMLMSFSFFIEPGATVSFTSGGRKHKVGYSVSGSKLNDILMEYLDGAAAIVTPSLPKDDCFSSTGWKEPSVWADVQFAASLTDTQTAELNKFNLEYIDKNLDNAFSLALLNSYSHDPAMFILLDKFYQRLASEVRNSNAARDANESVKKLHGARHYLDSLPVGKSVRYDSVAIRKQYYKELNAIHRRFGMGETNDRSTIMMDEQMDDPYFEACAKLDIKYIRDNITNPIGIRLLAGYGRACGNTYEVSNYLIYRFYPQIPGKYADMPKVKKLKAAYDRIVYMKKLVDAM